jgi:hypothetical protein
MLAVADTIAEKLYLREYTLELLLFLCLTRRAEQYFFEQGVTEDMFIDVMRDFKYKIEECKLVKGVVGTFVPNWHIGNLHVARRTFGRLQYEVNELEREYTRDGKVYSPQTKVLGVHIPRTGEPLTPKACEESFDMAKEYYKDIVGDPCLIVCYSWLLYPENEKLLSPESNTYRFMKRFEILDQNISKDNGELWRLFDTDEKNPDRLPTNTSLQKAYVKHLKNGGKTGLGLGILFW